MRKGRCGQALPCARRALGSAAVAAVAAAVKIKLRRCMDGTPVKVMTTKVQSNIGANAL
jgi:hypothetical protein